MIPALLSAGLQGKRGDRETFGLLISLPSSLQPAQALHIKHTFLKQNEDIFTFSTSLKEYKICQDLEVHADLLRVQCNYIKVNCITSRETMA